MRVALLGLFGLFGLMGVVVECKAHSTDPLKSPLKPSDSFFLAGEKCQIWDDEQGISHASAPDELSGVACMGYLHARDRLWQMDYFRKAVQGRRAEFFGKDWIQSDFVLRLLGLDEKAKALFQEMPDSLRKLLISYTHGVNLGLEQSLKKGVYEFDEFSYLPEPWRPEDTIALVLLQSFDQTKRSFNVQLQEEKKVQKYGEEASTLFSHNGLPWDTSILKKGEYPVQLLSSSKTPRVDSVSSSRNFSIESAVNFLDLPGLFGGVGVGSNNWVLSPRKSQGTHAWLANDPHLGLSYPPFWYWSHVNAGSWDVIGASFPGVPFVVSGSNRHVSWGLTNSFLPAARISLVNEKELTKVDKIWPVIWVRLWKFKLPFFFKSFRRVTPQVPILPLPNSPSGQAYVLRWTGFDLSARDFEGLPDLMKAASAKEANAALSKIGVPSWNYVFADDRGQVGYRSVGRISRYSSPVSWGVPQETVEQVIHSDAFAHPLSAEEMPHILNPARGYVVTANNRQWMDDSVLSAGRAQHSSFRAFRIEELLSQNKRQGFEEIRTIQCDIQSVDARFILPKLLKVLVADKPSLGDEMRLRAIEELKAWNYEADLECVACGIYRRWIDHLLEQESLDLTGLYRKLTRRASEDVLEYKYEPLFQKSILDSFSAALEDLDGLEDDSFPKWGSIHLGFFSHLAGNQFFPVSPMGTPGDDHSVNPGTSNWKGDFFEHTDGASERLIVEMSQPPQVYSIVPGPNRDLKARDLADPESDRQKWLHCQYQKRNFPVDWTHVQSQTVIQF